MKAFSHLTPFFHPIKIGLLIGLTTFTFNSARAEYFMSFACDGTPMWTYYKYSSCGRHHHKPKHHVRVKHYYKPVVHVRYVPVVAECGCSGCCGTEVSADYYWRYYVPYERVYERYTVDKVYNPDLTTGDDNPLVNPGMDIDE